MTISYSLGFNPQWFLVDKSGLPLGAGFVAFFSSQNPTVQKLIYKDPFGNDPWPTDTIPNIGSQGVLIDANGTTGPFYFQFDSTMPNNLYYIEVYDDNGVIQWTFTGNPTGGSGGGSSIATIDIQNMIANNVFYRNVGN